MSILLNILLFLLLFWLVGAAFLYPKIRRELKALLTEKKEKLLSDYRKEHPSADLEEVRRFFTSLSGSRKAQVVTSVLTALLWPIGLRTSITKKTGK